jgi:hypothetical protein
MSTQTTLPITTNTLNPKPANKRYRTIVTANGKMVGRDYGTDLKALTAAAKSRYEHYIKKGARYADYAVDELLSKTSIRRGIWKELERAHYHPDVANEPRAVASSTPAVEEHHAEVNVALSRLDYLLTLRVHNGNEPEQTRSALNYVRQAREALESAQQLR